MQEGRAEQDSIVIGDTGTRQGDKKRYLTNEVRDDLSLKEVQILS